MKYVVFFCFALCSAALAREGLQLYGYFAINCDYRFIIADTISQKRSQWLAIGEEFDGLVLDSYDPKDETLTVSNGSKKFTLGLRRASIKANSNENRETYSWTARLQQAGTLIIDGRELTLNELPSWLHQKIATPRDVTMTITRPFATNSETGLIVDKAVRDLNAMLLSIGIASDRINYVLPLAAMPVRKLSAY